MCGRYNDCEKCPYWSYDINWYGEPLEDCEAGLNPEDGCKHSRLVRWILKKIQDRKNAKIEKYMMALLESEEENRDV